MTRLYPDRLTSNAERCRRYQLPRQHAATRARLRQIEDEMRRYGLPLEEPA